MIEKINREGFQSRNDLNYFLTDLKESEPWLYENHSKIGDIKMVQHRGIPQNSTIKQISITRKAKRWFANIVLNIDGLLPTISQKPVGIDLGITNFAYDSDGCSIPNPLNYTNLLKPLKRVQRKVSRRRKGSQNRKKAILWYRRIQQKIQNKRRDFLHKLSTQYAKRYGMIFLERLQKLNMVSNHRLAQRLLDSGWGTFERFLKYKTCVVLVAPNNTTVDCSRCGSAVPKVLGLRTHRCHVCGLVLDRDYNAAINILQKGMGILGMHESTAGTAGTYACRDLAEVIEAGRGYGLGPVEVHQAS